MTRKIYETFEEWTAGLSDDATKEATKKGGGLSPRDRSDRPR